MDNELSPEQLKDLLERSHEAETNSEEGFSWEEAKEIIRNQKMVKLVEERIEEFKKSPTTGISLDEFRAEFERRKSE